MAFRKGGLDPRGSLSRPLPPPPSAGSLVGSRGGLDPRGSLSRPLPPPPSAGSLRSRSSAALSCFGDEASRRCGATRKGRRSLGAVVALSGVLLLSGGCVQVDTYPPPSRRSAEDAGTHPRDSGPATFDAASDRACRECVTARCGAEWTACEDDPDCLTCLVDPLGSRCQRSAKRHDFRNCACARTTCLASCSALCPTPASTGKPAPSRIPAPCIQCTGNLCAAEVNACVVDPVCLACVSDAANPKCGQDGPWNTTTDCLCGRPRTCFEECCSVQP